MKKLIFVYVALAFTTLGFAQLKNPVMFSFDAVKKGSDYVVNLKATVQKPWHIYSQNTPSGGPLPTKITFTKNPLITFVGKTIEKGKLEKIFDNIQDVEVLYFSNEVVFSQTIKVKAGLKTNITGVIEYMVCDDKQCLPPTKKSFELKLN